MFELNKSGAKVNIPVLLETIATPAQLKAFSIEQLKQVADELRQAIVHNVSQTGGHFASNLGTVDMTVGLYATYNMPPDKIIWDVGHQAYPHKMLTGRLSRFPTLRQYGGLSGFLRRDESPFDVWGAGHASTSISAAVGFAVARDKIGGTEKIAAVIGDASLQNGLAWEALNHAGDLKADMTVILNDNKMSIAESVGAISTYLAKLRARPWFQLLEQQAKQAVEFLPKSLHKTASGLKHGVTYFVAPPESGAIFEDIGFTYIGPIDGHDIPTMLDVFQHARELKGPVFVHVITTKGKGYEVAEINSRKWHGVTPFGDKSGKIEAASKNKSYTQAFAESLVEEAKKDERIVAITAAMPDGTGLNQFQSEFPDRFYDVGIAEEHAMTFAAALAAGGLKPAIAIYSSFLQRSYDNIMHDVCLQNLPVKIFIDRAGLVGEDGPTHHGVFDLSFLGMIPNLVIMAPRDLNEMTLMTQVAMNYDNGPIAVRYPRGGITNHNWQLPEPIRIGKAEVLCSGDDVALIALGAMTEHAWLASEILSDANINATVINARFAKPIDEETITEAAERCKRIVIIEENVSAGGLGQNIIAALNKRGLGHVKIAHLCIPDRFIEHGALHLLRQECGLTADDIARTARCLIPSNSNARGIALIHQQNAK